MADDSGAEATRTPEPVNTSENIDDGSAKDGHTGFQKAIQAWRSISHKNSIHYIGTNDRRHRFNITRPNSR